MNNGDRTTLSGFSLMELVIVVGLSAFFAALLVPALRQGRDQAHAAICSSNQRSLYTAANLYAADYGEYYPDAFNPKAPSPYYTSWAAYIWHYIASAGPVASHPLLDAPDYLHREIRNRGATSKQGRERTKAIVNNEFFCPATIGPYSGDNLYGACASDGLWMDYGINGPVVGAPNWHDSLPKKRRTEIISPQNTALFADAYFDGATFFNASYYSLSPRHAARTRANVVVVDGHVESARWQRRFLDTPEQDISFQQSAWTGIGCKVYVVP